MGEHVMGMGYNCLFGLVFVLFFCPTGSLDLLGKNVRAMLRGGITQSLPTGRRSNNRQENSV